MQITKLTIGNTNIPLSLISLITIEESIFKPITYGSITLYDSILKESIEFFSGDEVVLYLEDDIISQKYTLKYMLYADAGQNILEDMEFNTVNLSFASKFAIDLFSITVTDYWKQKKISDIVNDVLNKISIEKGVFDTTLGNIDFTPPMWCPANVIGFLTKTAISTSGSAGYLFFPDIITQKMNFLSHESFVTNKLGESLFDIWTNLKLEGANPSSASDITLEKEFDIISSINKGTLNSNLNFYLQDGDENNNTNFKFSEFAKKTLSKKMPINKEFADTKYQTNFTTSYQTKLQNEAFIKNRYLKNLFSQIRINLTMAGSFERKAGQVVNLHYPSNYQLKTGQDDKKYTGKYIIHSIKHEISRIAHVQNIGLITDGYFDSQIENLLNL